MQAEFVKEETVVLRVAKRDSMGRTKEVADAMTKNDPRPYKIGEANERIAEIVEENLSQYPKVFYKVSLSKNGVPSGDIWPNCPMPSDLAADLGFADIGFVVKGKRREDGGYVDVRFPYRTMLVGIRSDGTPLEGMPHEERNTTLKIDVEKSREQEKDLRARGWVDSVAKLKFPETANMTLIRKLLGQPEPDEVESPSNGNGRGKAA